MDEDERDPQPRDDEREPVEPPLIPTNDPAFNSAAPIRDFTVNVPWNPDREGGHNYNITQAVGAITFALTGDEYIARDGATLTYDEVNIPGDADYVFFNINNLIRTILLPDLGNLEYHRNWAYSLQMVIDEKCVVGKDGRITGRGDLVHSNQAIYALQALYWAIVPADFTDVETTVEDFEFSILSNELNSTGCKVSLSVLPRDDGFIKIQDTDVRNFVLTTDWWKLLSSTAISLSEKRRIMFNIGIWMYGARKISVKNGNVEPRMRYYPASQEYWETDPDDRYEASSVAYSRLVFARYIRWLDQLLDSGG